MKIEEFMDSLIPAGEWQDQEAKETAMAEVEALLSELKDEGLVRETVSHLFEAFREEFGVG